MLSNNTCTLSTASILLGFTAKITSELYYFPRTTFSGILVLSVSLRKCSCLVKRIKSKHVALF